MTGAPYVHCATGRPTIPLPLTEAPGPFVELEQRYHPARQAPVTRAR